MQSFNLHDVDIFATGTHNGDTYTVADLDEMVRAFGELDFKPPIKAGHSEREPKDVAGLPALGWVENLRRVGDKLIADFTHMPKLVYEAIRDRRYATRSAEIYWNLERGGKKYSRALKALSILGGEIPAVAGLRPLYEYFSLHCPYAGTYKEFASDDGAKFYFEDPQKGIEDMADPITKEQFDALEKRYAALEKAMKDQDAAREKLLADAKAAAEADAKRYKDELAARDQRLAALESERHKASVQAVADTCTVPALRPFVRVFQDLATRTAGIKAYAADGKEEDATKIVSDFIAEINKNAAKLFTVHSKDTTTRPEGTLTPTEASAKVAEKIAEYRAKDPKADYVTAMRAVLNADPELKTAYAAAA